MEQAPLVYCGDCKKIKASDQFTLRIRNSTCGARDEPSSRCSSCTTKERDRGKIRKRKRDEEGPDPSGDPAEPNCTTPIEQSTTLLPKQALTGDISCSARVSTQEIAGEADDTRAEIVERVCETTGFSPPCKTENSQKNGTIQRANECCQTTTSSKNRNKRLKMEPEPGKAPTASPLPVLSSPSRSHHTDVDGIVREGDLSGFSQPLSHQECYETLMAGLLKARNYFVSRAQEETSSEWLHEFQEAFEPAFKFIKELKKHSGPDSNL